MIKIIILKYICIMKYIIYNRILIPFKFEDKFLILYFLFIFIFFLSSLFNSISALNKDRDAMQSLK